MDEYSIGSDLSGFDDDSEIPDPEIPENPNVSLPIPNWIVVIIKPYLFLIFAIGIGGNSYIPFYFLRTKQLKRIASIKFMTALAFADLIYLVTVGCHMLFEQFLQIAVNDLSCKLSTYLVYLSCFLASWFIVVLTYERFVMFLPNKRHKLRNPSWANKIIFSILVVGSVFCIPVAITTGAIKVVELDPDSDLGSGLALEQSLNFGTNLGSGLGLDQTLDLGSGLASDLRSTQYPDLRSTQYPDLRSTQYPDLGLTQYPDLRSTQNPDLDPTQNPDLGSTHGSDLGSTQGSNLGSNESAAAHVYCELLTGYEVHNRYFSAANMILCFTFPLVVIFFLNTSIMWMIFKKKFQRKQKGYPRAIKFAKMANLSLTGPTTSDTVEI